MNYIYIPMIQITLNQMQCQIISASSKCKSTLHVHMPVLTVGLCLWVSCISSVYVLSDS